MQIGRQLYGAKFAFLFSCTTKREAGSRSRRPRSGLRSFDWARGALGSGAWESSRDPSGSPGSQLVRGQETQVCSYCPLPGRQEKVCLGSLWSGECRARGVPGNVPRSQSGVPVLGGEEHGTSHRAAPWAPVLPDWSPLANPRGRWTPSAAPWGPCPAMTASPPVCECGPASLSAGRPRALGLDASGVVRALGLVSSLTPLSLGPLAARFFILLFSSEGAKAATRAGIGDRRLWLSAVSRRAK